MVTFDWTTSRHDGVTLVTVRLTGIETPVRVTVRNRLDGPIWPPRREGVPEAGWTETGFEGVVGPGSHALGYATPAPPAEPPATLEDVRPAADADPSEIDTAADVVRALGDPSPPADAVPTASASEVGQSARGIDADAGELSTTDTPPAAGSSQPAITERTDRTETAEPADDTTAQLPAAVGPWVAEMARRTDHAEALAAAETLPAATTAVRDAGGLDGVRRLAAERERDERQLRTLARRAERLAERRATATIPVETLAAIA